MTPRGTDFEIDVSPWKRAASVVLSFSLTLAVACSSVVLRDVRRDQDFHWGNGGEEQIIGFLLIVGTPFLLCFMVIAISSVLLIPPAVQSRRWPVLMGIAAVAPTTVECLLLRQSPLRMLHNLQDAWPIYGFVEFLALGCCGAYLLMLRWLCRGEANENRS